MSQVTVGLDIGGSTTKIIGFKNKKLLRECLVKASDPVASAYGGFGFFLKHNSLKLKDISDIRITGVGASFIEGQLFDLPTTRADEFLSVGLGGLYAAKVDEAIVVSMGTGTSFVYANRQSVRHVIGSGVGGGTLSGLANTILNIRDIDTVTELAKDGDLSLVDLAIADISNDDIPGLTGDTTASNFGKVKDTARIEDLARGIVNLVFQSVGTAAVLAAKVKNIKTIVFTGNLIRVTPGIAVLKSFSTLYDVDIIIPKHAEFATAIGAALSRFHES
ncbi:MAG TPA: type II pantothenate kinase [Clostridiaceae bacterium]|nr:type II pantothenate kinase [Clostridiaceae bacterium]